MRNKANKKKQGPHLKSLAILIIFLDAGVPNIIFCAADQINAGKNANAAFSIPINNAFNIMLQRIESAASALGHFHIQIFAAFSTAKRDAGLKLIRAYLTHMKAGGIYLARNINVF